jgi:hypothetical protein
MLVNIDKSELTATQRELPCRDKLDELVNAVGTAMPLLTFKCDAQCISKDWNRDKPNENGGTGAYEEKIYRVKVYQDGEAVGSLKVDTRYRRSIGMETVFGVESFRIHKERGAESTTFTKDLKVALRTAKKMLVGRADEELYNHIFNSVKHMLRSFNSDLRNGVRYSVDVTTEAMAYAEAAYKAHLEGKTMVELPVKLKSVTNYEEYLNRQSEYTCVDNMDKAFSNKEGYAVKVLDDGKIIALNLETDTVAKYTDFSELPTEFANKFAMFKVIKEREPYTHIGVSLGDKFYYVVK